MHENAFALGDKRIHLVANHKYLGEISGFVVLPIVVEIRNSSIIEYLRIITETDLSWDQSVATERVLAWLLQIENSSNIELKHPLNNPVLLDETSSGSLASDENIIYQITVEALDDRIFAEIPVFYLAKLS